MIAEVSGDCRDRIFNEEPFNSRLSYQPYWRGRIAAIAAALKTAETERFREFESHSLRHIQQGSLSRAFSFAPMACHTCDYINNEILRKAKAAADALLALVKPEPDALKQDGTQQGN